MLGLALMTWSGCKKEASQSPEPMIPTNSPEPMSVTNLPVNPTTNAVASPASVNTVDASKASRAALETNAIIYPGKMQ